jgi:hypothetical protein
LLVAVLVVVLQMPLTTFPAVVVLVATDVPSALNRPVVEAQPKQYWNVNLVQPFP